jgi:hypothetical protein
MLINLTRKEKMKTKVNVVVDGTGGRREQLEFAGHMSQFEDPSKSPPADNRVYVDYFGTARVNYGKHFGGLRRVSIIGPRPY